MDSYKYVIYYGEDSTVYSNQTQLPTSVVSMETSELDSQVKAMSSNITLTSGEKVSTDQNYSKN